MISKNKILSGVAALCLCASAFKSEAGLPTYKTLSGTAGTSSTGSVLVFPEDPNSQIRIVNLTYHSDAAATTVQYTTGNGAYWQVQTNAASSSVTNFVNSTNGLVPGSVMVLNHNGTIYTNVLSTFNQVAGTTTNIVLGTGGWGVATTVGDNIYQMSATNTVTIGAGTNAINGDAVYVGNYGRPVMVRLSNATSANSLDAVTAHYDSASQ